MAVFFTSDVRYGHTNMHKIVKGTVTIDGQVYKAFEMFDRGPWKIVKGDKHGDPTVAKGIKAKSGKDALTQWLASREQPDA